MIAVHTRKAYCGTKLPRMFLCDETDCSLVKTNFGVVEPKPRAHKFMLQPYRKN